MEPDAGVCMPAEEAATPGAPGAAAAPLTASTGAAPWPGVAKARGRMLADPRE